MPIPILSCNNKQFLQEGKKIRCSQCDKHWDVTDKSFKGNVDLLEHANNLCSK